MGVVILVTAAAVEVALAVHRVRTGTPQWRARAVTRGGWLAGVVLLIGVGLISWSPRWYALIVVSLLLAVHALHPLVRPIPPDVPVRPWRAVGQAVLVTGLMFLATLPAIVFPDHEPLPPTGPHALATVTHTYLDAARTGVITGGDEPRRLAVQFWFPNGQTEAATSSHPLVVYSHGGAGIRTANQSLFAELASHGYVVASIDHTHHSLYTTGADGRTAWIDRTYWRELNREDARADPEGSLRAYRTWLQVRIDDLAFVLDRVIREAADDQGVAPYSLIDRDRVGVLGHSLGGSAALGIGRVRDDVRAVVALESPMLWDIEDVRDGRFVWTDDPYPIPVLHVYSDSSWGNLAEWPQYAANHALLHEAHPRVVNVHVAGVGHFGLTDLALTSPLLTRFLDGQRPSTHPHVALRVVNEVTLEFLDLHLRAAGR